MTDETVQSLATLVGGTVVGDGDLRIQGVADLRAAGPHDLGFVRDARYASFVAQSGVGAVLVSARLDVDKPQIVVDDVGGAFARVAALFHPVPRAERHAVHPTAVVDPTAEIEEPVAIGAHVTVGARSRIGAGTILHDGVVVGAGVVIGAGSLVMPRVVLYDGVKIGSRVTLHAGTVVGSDGFGYARVGAGWAKVPQLGGVEIGDDVEIGANCTIDRGALGATSIGRGTKIDNLVHVGHNCRIGEDCAIAGFGAFSGSTIVGDRVTIGGHVVTAGHMRIGDDVRIGGNSVVHQDVLEPGDYLGYPLQPKARWLRTLGAIDVIGEVRAKLRDLGRGE